MTADEYRKLVNASPLERRFAALWDEIGGEPFKTEHPFAKPRRWKFDFAWPDQKVAVEIEGGTFVRGRHQRPKGFRADCEKYDMAVELGWRVLRYTDQDLRERSAEVLEQVCRVLRQRATR